MGKYLREELTWVREDNEYILKRHEELNNVSVTKMHSNEQEKNKGPELNMERTAPYKRKVRRLEFSNHETEFQVNN